MCGLCCACLLTQLPPSASFDYDEAGWQTADVVRVDILVNGQPVDALASVCHRERAARNGRTMVTKLKDLLGRQMFEVAIQAAVGGKIVARETISAMRKNVLAKVLCTAHALVPFETALPATHHGVPRACSHRGFRALPPRL
jgi:hypothetical protein